jgi:V/A-type H+-transporting ATPase subunit I
MLKPLPMKHVRLLALTEDMPQVSLVLAELGSFHPDNRAPAQEQFPGAPGRSYRERYQQASSRLDKIGKLIPLPADQALKEVRVLGEGELSRVNDWLGEIWDQCSGYEEQFRRLTDEERLVHELENALSNFANLHIDLSMLRSKTRFLDFYVGIVPRENVRQLEGAVGLAKHLLYTYLVSGSNAHVVIVGPTGGEDTNLKSVLDSAGFQSLAIPPELENRPSQVRAELEQRQAQITAQRQELQEKLDSWADGFKERLADARVTLLLAEPFVDLDSSTHSSGHLAYTAGWVPARAVPQIEQRLRQELAHPFSLEARNPRPDERALVPTVPVRNRLLAPFAMLVKQYGIPRYGEVDPTPLFALTFVFMFGMMFGDVGQGAVIALAAWLARRILKRFTLFGVLIGLSSMVFGFLFGSIFGYEHVLHPLWISPLSDPIYMLSIALAWGVIFIVGACTLAIYNRLATGYWRAALFEHHGLVNLLFYLALIGGGYQLYSTGRFGWQATSVVLLSLLALAVYTWREMQAPTGEKLLVVVIETLETVIGYVSNTLSFLRVAAFSLNHVALSIAVFTLAGMMDTAGHWITVVLGNLFILVLEGGIVLIQVMRLEYYEGFSRYFFGDGREFTPVRLRASTNA